MHYLKYPFVILLLFLGIQYKALSISQIPPAEQQDFQHFLDSISQMYEDIYHKPLQNNIKQKISQLQLQPRTIERYNINFHAKVHLLGPIGQQYMESKRHPQHVLLEYLEPHQVLMPRPKIILVKYNQVIDTYTRQLPLSMAREVYNGNIEILKEIEEKYGVPSSTAIAILGCETAWGRNIGNFPILDSLATLAYRAPRRQDMYLDNLLAFIDIMNTQQTTINEKMYTSTFDGGMGIPQFEPVNYFRFAVSSDGTPLPDIWTNIPNAAASVSNYLNKHGWTRGLPPVYFVKLPADNITLKEFAAGRSVLTLGEWLKQGVEFPFLNTEQLNSLDKNIQAQLFIPMVGGKNQAFLLTKNFEVLMYWNPSVVEGLMISIYSQCLENNEIDTESFKN